MICLTKRYHAVLDLETGIHHVHRALPLLGVGRWGRISRTGVVLGAAVCISSAEMIQAWRG